MEKENHMLDLPFAVIRGSGDPSKDNSLKSITLEPEMEDFNDTGLLKNLVKELGIEESLSTEADPLKHDAADPVNCIHCKLVKKLTTLQADITKMSQEICATHDILNLKKEQNNDLKNMIKRLEVSIGKNQEDTVLDKSTSTCSCGNKCDIQ
jgi:hypothetical protein